MYVLIKKSNRISTYYSEEPIIEEDTKYIFPDGSILYHNGNYEILEMPMNIDWKSNKYFVTEDMKWKENKNYLDEESLRNMSKGK
jgi:hypothetical protein